MNQIKLFFITVTLIFINSSISFSANVYNQKLYSKNSEGKFYYDDFAEADRTWYLPIKGNSKYRYEIDSILFPIRLQYIRILKNLD